MAAAYKCTKISVGTLPSLSSGTKSLVFNFIDPRVSPAPQYTDSHEVTESDAADPTALMAQVDATLVLHSWPDTMDWTL